jgi:hypothetical protein
MNFEQYFQRQYNLSILRIEEAMDKLQGDPYAAETQQNPNTQNQGEGQAGPVVRGLPAGDTGAQSGSAEPVNGPVDIRAGTAVQPEPQ